MLTRIFKLVILVVMGILFGACSKQKAKIIVVKNTLDKTRSNETVELTKDFLGLDELNNIGVLDLTTGELQVVQLIDDDFDGSMNLLLFQPNMEPNSSKKYEIVEVEPNENPSAPNYCYSRFVPERTDDYAWENDKVAFRVFGPRAQQMIEEKIPGGTLSSGVDAWLKRVDYPIIDKWYKKTVDGTGSYHEDTGEGLDNFHVGSSRGVGGIAIKKDTTYSFSKNFNKWKTITTGPIRTSFYLEYAPWELDGVTISESRIISLDLGSNFSKYEITIHGVNKISAGLTLHNKEGKVSMNKEQGWLSYWETHGDSELGTAILTSPDNLIGLEKYEVQKADLSNAYAHINLENGSTMYYAGFGWKKTGQFKNSKEWENHLNLFAQKIENPLQVTYY